MLRVGYLVAGRVAAAARLLNRLLKPGCQVWHILKYVRFFCSALKVNRLRKKYLKAAAPVTACCQRIRQWRQLRKEEEKINVNSWVMQQLAWKWYYLPGTKKELRQNYNEWMNEHFIINVTSEISLLMYLMFDGWYFVWHKKNTNPAFLVELTLSRVHMSETSYWMLGF